MHKPQIALIIAKRTAAGDDLPDFGGEGFRDARSAAVSPCGHADHAEQAAAEPESAPEDYGERLAALKRAVSEVQSAVAALDSSPEPEPEGSSPDGEHESGYGEARKL
jgi:hypothetical protein